jgi:hypothetical protein
LYLNGPTESVFQVLTATLQANTTYTLTVDAGDRDGLTFQPCEIRLGTAANPLVSADFGLNLLTGTVVSNTTPVNGAGANDGWQTWVTTFTTGPSPAGLGNQLRVELVTTGGIQSYFDNVRLVATSATTGFAGWQSANGTSGAINEDHDHDGVSNGIEWFLGGNTDTTGFTALPGVSNTGGALSVTWTKDAGYPGSYGTDFRVETSPTLTGPWTAESSPGNVTITGNDVKYTFPSPLGDKNFARLKVTGP